MRLKSEISKPESIKQHHSPKAYLSPSLICGANRQASVDKLYGDILYACKQELLLAAKVQSEGTIFRISD